MAILCMICEREASTWQFLLCNCKSNTWWWPENRQKMVSK